MISEKMLNGPKYKFKHLKTHVLDKTEEGKVMAFAAYFVDQALPGEAMSRGLEEINQTLWNQQSTKRPPGYVNLGQFRGPGNVSGNIMVAEEWLKLGGNVRDRQEEGWMELGWLKN